MVGARWQSLERLVVLELGELRSTNSMGLDRPLLGR